MRLDVTSQEAASSLLLICGSSKDRTIIDNNVILITLLYHFAIAMRFLSFYSCDGEKND